MMGNRRIYTLSKQNELHVLMGNLPKIAPDWHSILEVIIALRTILRESQSFSVSSKVIVSRNVLKQLENYLKILGLSSPPISEDLDEYWNSFCQWFLNTLREVGQSNFWGSFHVDSVENTERQVCSLMQHLYVVQDCIDGLVIACEKNPFSVIESFVIFTLDPMPVFYWDAFFWPKPRFSGK